jgi:osmotically-inducible protein OsmY
MLPDKAVKEVEEERSMGRVPQMAVSISNDSDTTEMISDTNAR